MQESVNGCMTEAINRGRQTLLRNTRQKWKETTYGLRATYELSSITMIMKNLIFVVLFMLVAAIPATAGEAERAANIFATVANDSIGGMLCDVKRRSLTIACAVNASDRETDRIASSMVMQARLLDMPLSGWSLMLVNLNDYVVSMKF